MQLDAKVTETLITGMTKGELAAVVIGTVFCMCALIWALSYIMHLHLKPLSGLPKAISDMNNEIYEIKGKVKSSEELKEMIQLQIQEHELKCPFRDTKTQKITRN